MKKLMVILALATTGCGKDGDDGVDGKDGTDATLSITRIERCFARKFPTELDKLDSTGVFLTYFITWFSNELVVTEGGITTRSMEMRSASRFIDDKSETNYFEKGYTFPVVFDLHGNATGGFWLFERDFENRTYKVVYDDTDFVGDDTIEIVFDTAIDCQIWEP